MPCNCQQPEMPANRPSAGTGRPRYVALAGTVRGRNGRDYAITQPLVPPSLAPTGGWGVGLVLNGVPCRADGGGPVAVFREARRLFLLNGVTVDERDLWATLNMDWVERTSAKHRLVDTHALQAAVCAAGDLPAQVERHPPAKWLLRVWATLGMDLACSVYHYEDFVGLVARVVAWANPAANPGIGDAAVYLFLSQAHHRLVMEPVYERRLAREWLVVTMNEASRRFDGPERSRDEVAKLYHWTNA